MLYPSVLLGTKDTVYRAYVGNKRIACLCGLRAYIGITATSAKSIVLYMYTITSGQMCAESREMHVRMVRFILPGNRPPERRQMRE